VELRATDKPGMSRWRKQLFLATAVIAAEPADYFRLPSDRTVTLGSQIEF
jgi:KUP system potassium uptake protein